MTRPDPRPPFPRPDGQRLLVIALRFLVDLEHWIEQDRNAALRLTRLMGEIARTPFTGVGKPEPLRHNLRGYWSRRITDKDRLLYSVDKDFIEFVSARHHY
jgi:toxin YoeB